MNTRNFFAHTKNLVGSSNAAPPAMDIPVHASLSLRAPARIKQLQLTRKSKTLNPEEYDSFFIRKFESARGNPARILQAFSHYASQAGKSVDAAVASAALQALGATFDQNSFWSNADRQNVCMQKSFKYLLADLAENFPENFAPGALASLAALNYKPKRLLPIIFGASEKNLDNWNFSALVSIAASAAILDAPDFQEKILQKIGEFPDDQGSLNDWASAAFSSVAGNFYSLTDSSGNTLTWKFLKNACDRIISVEDLDNSGWAQFFIYQSLYAADVELPKEEISRLASAVPLWVQERLHANWLDGILLTAQIPGICKLQADVEAALKRTHTQARMNCSFGRDADSQHCWFASFLLEPRIVFELENSRWLQLKTRLLKKMDYRVAVINEKIWWGLTEEQKDETVLSTRQKLGYVHDREWQERTEGVKVNNTKNPWAPLPKWKPIADVKQ